MTTSKRILVIDDDVDIHNLCRLVFEKEGYTVTTARTGVEGQNAALAVTPDVVILDVMMESADAGFQTAKWFAKHQPDVPVLLFSCIVDAADGVFDLSSLKVAALANKLISPNELLDIVRKLLE